MELEVYRTMGLGEKIRELRAERGMSSGELAKESGVSRAYLWQLETGGKDKPSFDVLQRLASALGVGVSEFSEQDNLQDLAEGAEMPSGLHKFVAARGRILGVRKTDIEVMENIHFRGKQPEKSEDWELLFLFLKKWAR